MDVDCTAAQDVQAVVVIAACDQRAPAPEVLHAESGNEGFQLASRKILEGRVLSQEVTDLGQFDVEGHVLIVAPSRAVHSRTPGSGAERHTPSPGGGVVLEVGSCRAVGS